VAFYVVWNIYRRWDWIPGIAHLGSSRFSFVSVVLSLATLGIMAYQFVQSPPVEAGEPLALTLNPNYGKSVLQNHRVAVSKHLDSLEAAARASYQPNPVRGFANVIVIVVDALRADHLSLNGYHRMTTRHLDQLQREGKLNSIGKAYGSCAESSCGLMALASSRNLHAFPSQPFTLQEVLKNHGFRLNMLLSGDHTNFYGLRSAYGPVDFYVDGSSQKKYYMNDDRLVIDEVSNLPTFDGNPAFFQFHLMSTHGLSKRDPAASPFKPFNNYYADFVKKTVVVDDERAQSYVNYYDNGVRRTDQVIRSILDALDSKGYLTKAFVVITADHGELLGEHGLFSHAKTVFGPVLDVPLMFLRFGYQPRKEIPSSVVASQIDIAPTILAELGMPIPKSWSGLPLQSLNSPQPTERYLFFQQGTEFGLVEVGGGGRRWKYWVDAKSGREFAFETIADPGEEQNRIADVPVARRDKWRIQLLQAEVQSRESSLVEHLPE
jgi:glucan phosphoethanolaminetransferase (alkaline phosphatase superfamily)